MKTHSITFHSETRTKWPVSLPKQLKKASSLPCLAFMVLLSALPSVALVLLVTWASNVAVLLPAVQAATGLSSFVFLALAMDSKRPVALLQLTTAPVLFGLAWLGSASSPEFLVLGSMVVAAWMGTAAFSSIRTRCL